MDVDVDVRGRLLEAAKSGEAVISFGDVVNVSLEDGVYKVGDWEGSEIDDVVDVVTTALEAKGTQYKPPPGWNDPQSWLKSEKGAEEIRAAAWAAMGSSVTSCITHMEDRVDDAGAFCASLKDAIEGPEWRKGPREKKKEEDVITIIEKVIVDEGDKVVLYSKNKSKVLGSYPYGEGKKYKNKETATKAAEEREREIQFFKHQGKEWLATWIEEKEVSLNQVQDAFYNTFNPPDAGVTTGPRIWTKDVFPTAVVVEDAGKLYRVSYTTEGDNIEFAERGNWEVGRMVWEAGGPPVVLAEEAPKFWHSQEARMFLAAAKAWVQRKKSETVVWKEGDRRFYLGLISLPSIKDKEGEVVTAEAADRSIAIAEKYGYRSGLYIKHVVPESLVGRSIRERRIGPFWVEFGEFKDTPLADYAFKILKEDMEGKWKFSIGFITPKKQALAGRYTRLLKFDSTITEVPAQPLTAMLALMGKGGSTMDGTSVNKLMTFLNPETDEEKDQVTKMLSELFEVEEKELVAVAKRAEGASKVEAAIALLEDGALKEALAAVLKAKPWEEEDEEGKKKKKKKEVEPVVDIEAVIAKALEPVVKRLDAIEVSAGAAALTELREVLLTRSKDYVKPAETAQVVEGGDDILKRIEKMLDPAAGKGKHPLADFAHGPAPAEGG